MEMPNIVKLTDLVLHIEEDTRVCIKCRFRGMHTYQVFYGSEAGRLPADILSSLCVEHIGVKLEMFPNGIVPTLEITASDDVSIIGFDVNQIFQQYVQNPDMKESEPEDTEEID